MRMPELQRLIDRLTTAFAGAEVAPPARAALDRVFARLAAAPDVAAESAPAKPPAPRLAGHLDGVLSALQSRDDALGPLAQSLAALAPHLAWAPRGAGGPHASPDFAGSHANVMLFGPGGQEPRSDVWIGASLMAPHTRYPDHTHPPEEVYIALTDGAFLQTATWTDVEPGDTVYNTPGITHAMRCGAAPFLAIWCLPV